MPLPTPEYALLAKAFVGLLAIVDPLGTIPIFLTLSAGLSATERRAVARRAAMGVAVILTLSIWTGETLLSYFGIGIPAFRTGGGLLILLMATSMMHARRSASQQTPEETDEAVDKQDIALVPLAIPLLAGPAAITLVVVEAHQSASTLERLGLNAAVLLISATVWLALRLAAPIGKRLGITGMHIATRIMGLLLAAIAFQMMAAGLVVLLPGLAG